MNTLTEFESMCTGHLERIDVLNIALTYWLTKWGQFVLPWPRQCQQHGILLWRKSTECTPGTSQSQLLWNAKQPLYSPDREIKLASISHRLPEAERRHHAWLVLLPCPDECMPYRKQIMQASTDFSKFPLKDTYYRMLPEERFFKQSYVVSLCVKMTSIWSYRRRIVSESSAIAQVYIGNHSWTVHSTEYLVFPY